MGRVHETCSVALVYEPTVAALAERVAAGLAHADIVLTAGNVEMVSPTAAASADLVVLGSPATSLHSHRGRGVPGPRPSPEEVGFPSMREWLAAVPSLRADSDSAVGWPHFVAAFDTRLSRTTRTHTSASTQAARFLTRRGFELAGRPMSFLLDGLTEDPANGEGGRAERWGYGIAEVALARLHGRPAGWWNQPSGTDHQSTTVPFNSPGPTRH